MATRRTRPRIWDQFAEWVQQQVAAAASANFVWATQRAALLAQQVADHFAQAGEVALPDIAVSPTDGDVPQVAGLRPAEQEKFGLEGKALTGLRGGYMGGSCSAC